MFFFIFTLCVFVIAVSSGGGLSSMMGGDATAMMMAAAKLATTATGPATTNKVDDVIEDINKKKQSIRIDNEEQLNAGSTARKSDITAKQRWNWAYNKIIMQLNVSTMHDLDYSTISIAWPDQQHRVIHSLKQSVSFRNRSTGGA